MAFSVKIILLIVLFALLSSKHIYARDSRFFSKMPRTFNDNSKTLEEEAKEIEKQVLGPLYRENDSKIIPDNSKTLEEEAKEIEKQVLGPLYREKDSNIIPENLYREKDSNIIPENERNKNFAPLDNEIVNTSIDKIVDEIVGKSDSSDNEKFNEDTRSYLPNNYNAESYVTDSQGYHRNTGKDVYTNYATKAEDSNAMEKQGMSDTEFLEDGKYFYDINLEKNGGNNGRFFGYKNNGGYYYHQQDIPNDDIPNEYKIGYNNKPRFQDFKFDYELP